MSIIYKKTLNTDSDFEAIPSHKLILVFNNYNYLPSELIKNLIKNGVVEMDYYPLFVNNEFINKKYFFLFNSLSRDQYILVNNERKIVFTPIYYNKNFTKVDMPKEREKDNIIYYSDGTIEKISSWTPNYNKLKSIN
ncbi:hypothetical protein I5E72_18315 [Proteus terrae]|nr:hypothetical protein [Proteus terrae]